MTKPTCRICGKKGKAITPMPESWICSKCYEKERTKLQQREDLT